MKIRAIINHHTVTVDVGDDDPVKAAETTRLVLEKISSVVIDVALTRAMKRKLDTVVSFDIPVNLERVISGSKDDDGTLKAAVQEIEAEVANLEDVGSTDVPGLRRALRILARLGKR